LATRTVSFLSQVPLTEKEQARPSRRLQVQSEPQERDLSDVVRCGGANSSTRGGLDIYIDLREDHESGETIMVKKKKSCVALEGLSDKATSTTSSQTPFGESTNAPVPLMGQIPKTSAWKL
jgi:hypothetical protein